MSILLMVVAVVVASGSSATDIRRLHAQFGQCVVERQPAASAEYVLDVETDDVEALRMHRELPLVGCWEKLVGSSGAQLRLPADNLRYTLADALVRREFAGPPISNFSVLPALKRATLNEEYFRPKPGKNANARELGELARMRSDAITAIEMAAFGECVARAAPLHSHALLMTTIGSAEESVRFEALSGAFGGCLPARYKLNFDRSFVRGALALSYYRLAKASSASQAQGSRQ